MTGFTGAHNVNGGNGSGYYGALPGKVGTYYTQQISTVYTLSGLSFSAATVAGGQIFYGTLTLSGVAPTGGLTVALTSSNTAALTVPDSVVIPEGASSYTFPLTASFVSADRAVTVQAAAGGILQTAGLTVRPWLNTLQFNPISVSGGGLSSGVVTLNLPASASGVQINLSSSDPGVTFPDGASVLVPSGALVSPAFRIQTQSVATAKAVTITTTYLSERKTGTVYNLPGGRHPESPDDFAKRGSGRARGGWRRDLRPGGPGGRRVRFPCGQFARSVRCHAGLRVCPRSGGFHIRLVQSDNGGCGLDRKRAGHRHAWNVADPGP